MTKIKVPKPEVLRAAFANIQANLSHWTQSTWGSKWTEDLPADNECGTVACLAGHILLSQGIDWKILLSMSGVPDRAMEALGFEQTPSKCDCGCGGDVFTWGKDGDEFERLFFFTNDEATGKDIEFDQESFDLFRDRVSKLTGVEL